MIEYVNVRLNEWARWLMTGRSALYASPGIYFRKGEGDAFSSPGAIVPIDELEADRTHRCVIALEPLMQKTVGDFYCRSSTAEDIARHLGVSKATLFRRVDRAHVLIMGYMNDIVAGVPVHPWHELKRQANLGRLTRETESV